MIQIKDRASTTCDASPRGNTLLKTYTLYLRGAHDGDRFEPAMCHSDGEAMARARALLALHADCRAVEVFFGPERLFRLDRAAA